MRITKKQLKEINDLTINAHGHFIASISVGLQKYTNYTPSSVVANIGSDYCYTLALRMAQLLYKLQK